MSEEQKPKRKYTKRAKQAHPEVYSVLVRVTRGRKIETIHCESTRIENGCLVAVSLDGPPPLIEKTIAKDGYVELWCETNDEDDLTVQNGVLLLTSID